MPVVSSETQREIDMSHPSPEIGSVFLWCGCALYRVESKYKEQVITRRVGSIGPPVQVSISSSTDNLTIDHHMFKLDKLYACPKHGGIALME